MNYPVSDLHITFVAKITAPNLSPILDTRLGCKRVILLHTKEFEREVEHLSHVYKRYQIRAEPRRITSAFDMKILQSELSDILLEELEHQPLINITNGTKLMSLALYEQARTLELPIYYLNTNDTISWLYPKQLEPLQLQDRIKASAFLMAHGLELVSNRPAVSDKSYRHLLDWMISNLNQIKKAIPQLNYYAFSAGKNLKSKPLQGDTYQLEFLLDQFQAANIARIQNNQIVFKDEDARFFANGGWLEEYLYHQIRQLSSEVPEIQDYLCSAEVMNTEHQVKNEIDNLILVNNHLYLIECKTKKFNDRGNPDGGAMTSLYKMDTLMAELGGPLTRGMVASVFKFSAAEQKRAAQYDIKLMDLECLPQAKQIFKQWFITPKHTD